MPSDRRGAADQHRADNLRSSVDEQVREFFVASRYVAPIGNIVAGLIALSLLWDHVPTDRLWIWFGAVVVLAARQAVDALHPERIGRPLENTGFVFDKNVAVGVVWGLLPWLDVEQFASSEVYQWTCMALVFAIGAGSMGGLSVLAGLAMRVQLPLFTLLAAAFLFAGVVEVGAGVLVYLGLMTNDLWSTGRILRGLVNSRVEAADLAVHASSEARHDVLTGLLNRAGAFEEIERHRGTAFVLMFVDLDYFKEVNDRLGHDAGDAVLVEAAHRISGVMRPEDLVARLGGDEFLVVFERGDADLHEVSRRVLAEVERPIAIRNDEALISASIGLTVVDEPDWETPLLLRRADSALYEAKRTGRQRIVWFDDRLALELEERTSLEADLRRAIELDQIGALARPAVHLATGEISSVELTPHFVRPDGSEVRPEVVMALAEEIGLIDPLTRSLLDRAAQSRVRWRGHFMLGSAPATVRVAANYLMRGGLVDDVADILASCELGLDELQLMVTDTAEIRDPQFAADAMKTLRAMGVGIVLGEFGSGKSTLRDLLQLPIDVVSLHPRLVHDAPGHTRLQKLLGGMHHIADGLDLSLMADGVDTAEQLDLVRRLGLDYAQGEAVMPVQPVDAVMGIDLSALPTTVADHGDRGAILR